MLSGIKNQQWSPFKLKRRRILRFLIAERNRLNNEVVFEEDAEKVKQYDEVIKFLQCLDYNPYNKKCPVCGSRHFTEGVAEGVGFYGRNDENDGKIEILTITHCLDCGWYQIEGW